MNGATRPSYLMPETKLTKKNSPATCGETTEFNFVQKPKKAEKTDFEPLPKAQISFSCKIKYATHLRFFFTLQNETKMKKIRRHDLFFDFDLLSLMCLLGMKKIFVLAEISAIFNRMIVLNIRKDRDSLACYQECREKRQKTIGLHFFVFFLPHYGNKKANY
jgi:hypothetical protein